MTRQLLGVWIYKNLLYEVVFSIVENVTLNHVYVKQIKSLYKWFTVWIELVTISHIGRKQPWPCSDRARASSILCNPPHIFLFLLSKIDCLRVRPHLLKSFVIIFRHVSFSTRLGSPVWTMVGRIQNQVIQLTIIASPSEKAFFVSCCTLDESAKAVYIKLPVLSLASTRWIS